MTGWIEPLRRTKAALVVLACAALAGAFDVARRRAIEVREGLRSELLHAQALAGRRSESGDESPTDETATLIARHPAVAAALARIETLAEDADLVIEGAVALPKPPPGQQVFRISGRSQPDALLRLTAAIEAERPLMVVEGFQVVAQPNGSLAFELDLQRPYRPTEPR